MYMTEDRPVAEWAQSIGGDLDYTINWEDWLDTGDGIVTSTWAAPSALTLADDHDTLTATVFVRGVVAGTAYDLTNTITTSNGLIDSRTIRIVGKRR